MKTSTVEECLFCIKPEDGEPCEEVNYAVKGYICTRPKGHKGDCVACAIATHEIETWNNNK